MARRRGPLPPLPVAELAARSVHVVVRDYPETLAVFRRAGIDAAERGAEPIQALADDAGPLLDELRQAVDWRRES